jgi:hypothetical protein
MSQEDMDQVYDTYAGVDASPQTDYEWPGMDVPVPDVRKEHVAAAEKGELRGCGLHKNFSYEDIVGVQESLRQRRILTGVPTPDVIEFYRDKDGDNILPLEDLSHVGGRTQYRYGDVQKTLLQACEYEMYDIKDRLREELKHELMSELLKEITGLLGEFKSKRES